MTELSTVRKVLRRSQFTLTLGKEGDQDDPLRTYILRKLTGQLALKIVGTKTFGMVRGAIMEAEKKRSAVPEYVPTEDEQNEEKLRTYQIMKCYLEVCMVSPRLGPESTAEADVVAFEDLGGDEEEIFAAILKSREVVEDLENFPQSSEVQTG